VWKPKPHVEMAYGYNREKGYGYTTDAEYMTCDLCGQRRHCNEGDGIVACQACQRELLPSGWAL